MKIHQLAPTALATASGLFTLGEVSDGQGLARSGTTIAGVTLTSAQDITDAIDAAAAGYATVDSRGRLSSASAIDLSKVRYQGALVGSTTSVERWMNPSFAFSGGTATQLYLGDADDYFHTGYTGTGASAQAGWVSHLLAFYLPRLVSLDLAFRYDALDMGDNHRAFHGLSFGTPAYSTPADEFDSSFACLTALGGVDTTWKLRTRTASGTVYSVDTTVAVAQGVVYDARLYYSGGAVYATMSADGGAWSTPVSTSSGLPTATALRVVSYARVASPSAQIELGNAAWGLVTQAARGS